MFSYYLLQYNEMKKHRSNKTLLYLVLFIAIFVFYVCGGFLHLFAESFDRDFSNYPYSGNVKFLVDQMMNGADFTPTNTYYFEYKTNASHMCKYHAKLIFLVKSAPENYANRDAIRRTWGMNRMLDGKIKTVFLIGAKDSESSRLMVESNRFKDLIQGNFSDSYFNNTIKTMMGFKWAFEFCSKTAEYFMFVDDDYYVSPKNVLKFVKNPYTYPGRDVMVHKYSFTDFGTDKFEMYAGYVFKSSPFRSFFSKWYLSLEDYPYNKFPPYVTAGAYVLSRMSLKRMYYASLFTQHFKFDDVYVGILSYKLGVYPIHNDNFHFHKKLNDDDFALTIASHGYGDPKELWKVWNDVN